VIFLSVSGHISSHLRTVDKPVLVFYGVMLIYNNNLYF